jgi:sulfur-oxidizing protein SoxZ
MTEPTRIRAQAQGSGAVVRVLMAHEMESGQRKDAAGRVVPAWHITNVTATLNGRTVFTAEWGPAVSRNPFLQFTLKGAKAGDKVGIAWKDSRGASRSDEAVVA